MIYSKDINRVCALCANADIIADDDENMQCRLKGLKVGCSDADCGNFIYDIFKKRVRRKPRPKREFTAEDFKLED